MPKDNLRKYRPKHVAHIHVRATDLIKIDLCCERINKCGLFGYEHSGIASVKMAMLSYTIFFRYYVEKSFYLKA